MPREAHTESTDLRRGPRWEPDMRFRLLRPRELAQALRHEARSQPATVEQYLDANSAQWAALAEADPHDAADILQELGPAPSVDLVRQLDGAHAAPVFEEMRTEMAAELLVLISPELQRSIVESMNSYAAADLLGVIDDTTCQAILKSLEPATGSEITRLLRYAPDSAGGLMRTDFAVLPVGLTAGEAIETLRGLNPALADLSYVYVTDDTMKLVGVVSFRDLVYARPGVGLDEAMVPEPMAVTPDTDREAVAEITSRYNFFGLPVVDEEHHLIGVIYNEAVIEAIRREASEDFAAAVGAGAEETVFSPIPRSVRMRLPWLVVNLVMAVMVAMVIDSQSDVIEANGVLAALMPVVALLGGNAGAQSLAVVIRALAADELPGSRVWSILGKQAAVGAINSIPIGLLAGGVGALFGGFEFAVIMGLATMANLTIAAFAGGAIPLALRAMGQDPALASNIFLTLLTDIVGFGGFLVVASLLL